MLSAQNKRLDFIGLMSIILLTMPTADEQNKAISQIEAELDNIDENSILFETERICKLRNYVFQTHSRYDYVASVLIVKYYLRSTLSQNDKQTLLDKIPFFDKANFAKKINESFPLAEAKQLNHLRNKVAHNDGMLLRYKYSTGAKYLKAIKLLKKYQDKLDNFINSNNT